MIYWTIERIGPANRPHQPFMPPSVHGCENPRRKEGGCPLQTFPGKTQQPRCRTIMDMKIRTKLGIRWIEHFHIPSPWMEQRNPWLCSNPCGCFQFWDPSGTNGRGKPEAPKMSMPQVQGPATTNNSPMKSCKPMEAVWILFWSIPSAECLTSLQLNFEID